MLPAKVAALITRHVDGATEVCVFDHFADVQLPAGTMDPGEEPVESAAREVWEETGLPHLDLVGEVASMWELELDERPNRAVMVAPHTGCPVTRGHAVTVHERTSTAAWISSEHFGWEGEVAAACVERDVSRHVFHLRTTRPTPDAWWVLTPDGGGVQWRCRWVPVDEVDIHPWQQRWIDAASERIDPGPPVPRLEPLAADLVEVHDAHNVERFLARTIEGPPLLDVLARTSLTERREAVLRNDHLPPGASPPAGGTVTVTDDQLLDVDRRPTGRRVTTWWSV